MRSAPSILARFGSYFWLKAIVTPIFMTVFFMAYFAILRHPLRPPTLIPLTVLDRWVGFHPWALFPYVSLWIYVSLPSALTMNFRELLVHALGAAALSVVGLVIFIVWPTSTPHADVDWSNYIGMQFLKDVDAAGNACPSLHAAFAVFAGFWLARVLHEMNAPRWTQVINVLWAIAIVYSTLATRQHVAIDTLSGALLGWVMARLNLCWVRAPATAQFSSLPAQ